MENKYPFGLEYDKKLLSVILKDPTFLQGYSSTLKPEYFVDELHQDIYTAVITGYEKAAETITRDSLEIELKNCTRPGREWNNYIRRLDELYRLEVTDPGYIKETAVEFGRLRNIWGALGDGLDLVADGEVEKAERELRKAFASGAKEDTETYSLRDDYRSRVDAYGSDGEDEESPSESRYCPTGITDLDTALNGGLCKGELGVVLGPPNRGKTTVLCNFGYAAVRSGLSVAHYTLELSPRDTLEIYDRRITNMTLEEMQSDPELAKRSLNTFFDETEGRLEVRHYLPSELTVTRLKNDLEWLRIEKNFNFDLILVDYAGIMKPERVTDQSYQDKGSISLGLRGIATAYNVPLWTGWQINREGSKDEIERKGMEYVAESSQLNHHADQVISLCNNQNDRAQKLLFLYGAKARRVQSEYMVKTKTEWERGRIIGV